MRQARWKRVAEVGTAAAGLPRSLHLIRAPRSPYRHDLGCDSIGFRTECHRSHSGLFSSTGFAERREQPAAVQSAGTRHSRWTLRPRNRLKRAGIVARSSAPRSPCMRIGERDACSAQCSADSPVSSDHCSRRRGDPLGLTSSIAIGRDHCRACHSPRLSLPLACLVLSLL